MEKDNTKLRDNTNLKKKKISWKNNNKLEKNITKLRDNANLKKNNTKMKKIILS